jgi:hypothetical protein
MLLRQKQADILERLFQEHSVAENLRSFAPVCCCSGVLSSVATVAANQQLAAAGSGASNFPNNQPYNAPQPSGIILPSSSPPTISSPFVVFFATNLFAISPRLRQPFLASTHTTICHVNACLLEALAMFFHHNKCCFFAFRLIPSCLVSKIGLSTR